VLAGLAIHRAVMCAATHVHCAVFMLAKQHLVRAVMESTCADLAVLHEKTPLFGAIVISFFKMFRFNLFCLAKKLDQKD
jgi:hypothetical protein